MTQRRSGVSSEPGSISIRVIFYSGEIVIGDSIPAVPGDDDITRGIDPQSCYSIILVFYRAWVSSYPERFSFGLIFYGEVIKIVNGSCSNAPASHTDITG